MEISKETKAAVKPALWGAAAGAIALAIVGFSWETMFQLNGFAIDVAKVTERLSH